MIIANRNFRVFSSLAFFLFKFVDLLLLILLGVASYHITQGFHTENAFPKSLIIIGLLVFFISAQKFDLYRPWRDLKLRSELWLIAITNCNVMFVLLIVGSIVGSETNMVANLKWIILWGVSITVSQIIMRVAVRHFLRAIRALGFNQRSILLVGTHKTAKDVLHAIRRHPEFGLQVIGYLDDREKQRDERTLDLGRLGSSESIVSIIDRHKIDQVWITYPMHAEDRAKEVIERMKYSTVSVRFVFDLQMIKNNEKSLTEFAGIPLLDIDVSPMDGLVGRAVKNIEDKFMTIFALAILSPLFLVIAIGVKLSSPGPIFYKQTRIGWNNKPFNMLKFRSMPEDIEKNSGPKWTKAGESRATMFGAFIRKTSLDELPQLINVLKGDMSIIGPRPERPEFIEKFKTEIPDYMKKHMVKGGITGWAQVNGYRGDTDLKARIEYDLYYIKNWSPMFDAIIALQTFYKGFINKNAY